MLAIRRNDVCVEQAVPAPFSKSDERHRQDGAGLILLFLTRMQS